MLWARFVTGPSIMNIGLQYIGSWKTNTKMDEVEHVITKQFESTVQK